MKLKTALLCVTVCLISIAIRSATIYYSAVDNSGNPSNAQIKLRAYSTQAGLGTNTLVGATTIITPTNGIAVFPLVVGRYQSQVGNLAPINIYVPDTADTLQYNDLVENPNALATMGQVRLDYGDSRGGYLLSELLGGTNILFTITTNAGNKVLTISTADGGLGLTGITGDVVATGPGSVPGTIQPNAVTTTKVADRNVTDPKIEYSVSGVTSSGGTLTFDYNGSRRQTNAENGSLIIALSNKPSSAVDRWIVAQFLPLGGSLALTWPGTVSGSTVRWLGNARTTIAQNALAEIAVGWNGVEVLLSDMSSVGPGGANTQVQFNDSGVFNGTAGFTYNKTTGDVNLNGSLSVVGSITSGSDMSGTMDTSNDVATTMYTRFIDTNTTVTYRAFAYAAGDTTSTVGALHERHAVFRRESGSAALIGTNSVSTVESDAGLESGFALAGNTAGFQVKGLAGTTVSWVLSGTITVMANPTPSYRLLTTGGDYLLTTGGDYINVTH